MILINLLRDLFEFGVLIALIAVAGLVFGFGLDCGSRLARRLYD